MAKKTLKPLTREMYLDWAQMGQVFYLSELMSESRWLSSDIAFHGGTSLHLCWRSARHSEDLDFLLSRQVTNVEEVSKKVLNNVKRRFSAIDPLFSVSMTDKTKDPNRMMVFNLSIAHPHYIGTTKVKVEFWRTEPEYLKEYPIELRTPVSDLDLLTVVSNPVPAALLETAFADKLTAFATRPHTKWRDIYDLWWIGTQSPAIIDLAVAKQQFLHNLTGYQTLGGLSPDEALCLFLDKDKNDIFDSADPDIKKWLPEKLWNALNPDGIREMIDYVYATLEKVSQITPAIKEKPVNTNESRIRRSVPN